MGFYCYLVWTCYKKTSESQYPWVASWGLSPNKQQTAQYRTLQDSMFCVNRQGHLTIQNNNLLSIIQISPDHLNCTPPRYISSFSKRVTLNRDNKKELEYFIWKKYTIFSKCKSSARVVCTNKKANSSGN